MDEEINKRKFSGTRQRGKMRRYESSESLPPENFVQRERYYERRNEGQPEHLYLGRGRYPRRPDRRSQSCQRGNWQNSEQKKTHTNDQVRLFQEQQGIIPSFNEKRAHNSHALHPMHFKNLEKLVDQEVSEIIQVLRNPKNGFKKLLQNKPRPDVTHLIVQLLCKVCDTDFIHSQVEILSAASTCDFIDHLTIHVTGMLSEKNPSKRKGYPEFFRCLFHFFNKVIDLLPQTTALNNGNKLINFLLIAEMSIKNLGPLHGIQFDPNLFNAIDLLKIKIESSVEDLAPQPKKKIYGEPPDDFRNISLFPTAEDLKGRNFLRPNIVGGSYRDTHQYLDIQFRLLREDFIEPLRAGIKQYLDSVSGKETIKNRKNHHIRVYKNVRFVGLQADEKRNVRVQYLIKFGDEQFLKKMHWETNKRFMFGSLLMFTKDNFESFMLATVQDRNIQDLQKGELKVSLVGETLDQETLMDFQHVMAESKVFFEPYYQVMKALQSMSVHNLPLEKCILSQDCNPKRPNYLLDDCHYEINDFMFEVNSEQSWPSPEDLHLDEYQFKAFEAAIRNEFVVIQGPPGTGKTYLGLLIAKVLLENKNIWRAGKSTPIIVVCYTNHALDQFLEGLLKFTQKLIRIGGQSKNENLQQFNLKNFRQRHRNTAAKVGELKNKINYVLHSMVKIQNTVDLIKMRRGILSLSSLTKFISEEHLRILKNRIDFQTWLLGTYIPDVQISSRRNRNEREVNREDGDEERDEEYERRRQAMIDDYEELFNEDVPREIVSYEISLSALEVRILDIVKSLDNMKDITNSSDDIYTFIVLKDSLVDLRKIFTNIERKLLLGDIKPSMSIEELENSEVGLLEENDKWALYFHWEKKFLASVNKRIASLQKEYNKYCEELDEVQEIEDVSTILSNDVDVVGLTTTGAAKKRNLIAALKSKIVIVEEAAEVLEAHIVVSLSKKCEHLILIGDHEQLRPNPATFKLAKDFMLDISLFERMLRSGMNCYTLGVQHRMRPIIASLIVPTIYPHLENHPSVLEYPSILGVTCNLYFINHDQPEQEITEIESHINSHEGEFTIALCKYLILQGYNPNDITILTTYSGQQFFLRKEKNKNPMMKETRVTVVDNYQGEENKIILLSLVRSNKEGKIGFLAIKNRVCVALSRAKHALYIIGNMDSLKQASSMWEEIGGILESRGAIGTSLTLKCQVHDKITKVSTASDFNRVSEGGCDMLCEKTLSCCHKCTKLCHILDKDHMNYKCFETCEREICLESKHPCPKRCYEECEPCMVKVERSLPCGHIVKLPCSEDPQEARCYTKVEIKLKLCEHTVMKPCYIKEEHFKCTTLCTDRLPCGHACTRMCHKIDDPDHLEYKCYKECQKKKLGCTNNHKCNKKCFESCEDCKEQVQKPLPCGHITKIECKVDVETFKCLKKCKKELPCGHQCKLKCYEECGDCKNKVQKKIIECGHTVDIFCKETPRREHCKRLCERILLCGHKCKGRCATDCKTYDCLELTVYPVRQTCGHMAEVPCYKQKEVLDPASDSLLRFCQAACNTILPCGDMCTGTCGECMQGRIHKVCNNPCGNTLICGHKCKVPCRVFCPPCMEKCTYRCKHSACPRRCGESCVICKEKCDWSCKHYRCTKLCGELCDRPPCEEPCDERLKCGHPCVGFCGEPCPPLCRFCDKEILTEIFFGSEDEENARFILLEDCKDVLEANGLEDWIDHSTKQSDAKEITMILCPKCRTPIQRTLRFMNNIKSTYRSIKKIKEKTFGGKEKIIMSEVKRLRSNLKVLEKHKVLPEVAGNKNYKLLFTKLKNVLQPKNQKRFIIRGSAEVMVVTFFISFMEEFLNHVSRLKETSPDKCVKLFERIDLLLFHLSTRDLKIGEAEVQQFSQELQRLGRMIEYHMIMGEPQFSFAVHHQTEATKNCIEKIERICYSVEKYSSSLDKNLIVYLSELKKVIRSHVEVTLDERRMIHKAMEKDFHSIKQGHWFECSKGHIYVITECGGAMAKGICPECKEVIGGTNHSLVSTSKLNKTMDGAQFAAYSDTANLQNFEI